MFKKKQWIWWLAVTVAIAIILVVLKSKNIIGEKPGIEVYVEKVHKSDLTESVNASGKIQPETEVKISPDVPGEIIELNVREGDSVTKGQLIVRIKPDNYISQVEQAQASLNISRANMSKSLADLAQSEAQLIKASAENARYQKLFDQKAVTESELLNYKTNAEVAEKQLQGAKESVKAAAFSIRSSEAKLKEAQDNLQKTMIYAPVSGVISLLKVEKGERVVGTSQMAGTEMLRIANLHRMEVLVDVNENDIIRLSVGDTASVEVDSYADRTEKFRGIVTEMAGSAKATTSQDAVTEYEVKVRILSESYQDLLKTKTGKLPFRPGMNASVEIITDREKQVLVVPLAAVTVREGEKNGLKREIVFTIKEGKAVERTVKTGISDFENIEIREGLNENEEIIAGPYLAISKKLKDGEPVKLSVDKSQNKQKP